MAGTLIGPGLSIEGELTSQEEVVVHGTVRGTLMSHDAVSVGSGGVVEADIKAASLSVAGHVTGNVTANERVDIQAGGRLIGDVKASRLIHGGLVALDPDTLLPHPSLVRSLSLADGRTIAIELEPNVFFHSGHVLEASDVCATLDALRAPRLQSPHRSVVAAFSTCRVRDPQHAELTLAYPRATWMTDL